MVEPTVRPETNCLRRTIKTMRVGSAATIAPAAKRLKSVTNSPCRRASAEVIGRFESDFIKTNAQKKSL